MQVIFGEDQVCPRHIDLSLILGLGGGRGEVLCDLI